MRRSRETAGRTEDGRLDVAVSRVNHRTHRTCKSYRICGKHGMGGMPGFPRTETENTERTENTEGALYMFRRERQREREKMNDEIENRKALTPRVMCPVSAQSSVRSV